MTNNVLEVVSGDIYLDGIVNRFSIHFAGIDFDDSPLRWVSKARTIARRENCQDMREPILKIWGGNPPEENVFRELFCEDFDESHDPMFNKRFTQWLSERESSEDAWEDTQKLLSNLGGVTCIRLLTFADWGRYL